MPTYSIVTMNHSVYDSKILFRILAPLKFQQLPGNRFHFNVSKHEFVAPKLRAVILLARPPCFPILERWSSRIGFI